MLNLTQTKQALKLINSTVTEINTERQISPLGNLEMYKQTIGKAFFYPHIIQYQKCNKMQLIAATLAGTRGVRGEYTRYEGNEETEELKAVRFLVQKYGRGRFIKKVTRVKK